MTLSIKETSITSDLTPHTADLIDLTDLLAGWSVSWWNPEKLGDRVFDRNAAITAMSIAEEVAKGRDDRSTTNFSYRRWNLIAGWAEELGIKPLQAVDILEGYQP